MHKTKCMWNTEYKVSLTFSQPWHIIFRGSNLRAQNENHAHSQLCLFIVTPSKSTSTLTLCNLVCFSIKYISSHCQKRQRLVDVDCIITQCHTYRHTYINTSSNCNLSCNWTGFKQVCFSSCYKDDNVLMQVRCV